jgi:heme exporter protein B
VIYLRTVWLHFKKDLQLEWRSREAIAGMLFFTLLIAVVFAMAFDPTGYPTTARQMSGGLLWVGLLFAATQALNASWERERRNHVLDAHRMAASAASALFLGKALGNLVFVTFVEVVLAPVFVVFFNLHPLGEVKWLLLVLPLGTWAIVVNGTFFAALGINAKNRQLMLPVILFPVSIPALLGVTQATTGIITGDFEPGMWVRLLFGFDVIFTTACLLLFGTVLHAE